MTTAVPEPLVDRAGRLLAGALPALARVRRGMPVHPRGTVLAATLRIDGGAGLEPAGVLNRLRRPAYLRAQAARRQARADPESRQV